MFGQPNYMQAVAGTEPVGSYYSQLPEQLSYPNQEGSAYLPGFGHVSDVEPFGQDDMFLTPPELPPDEPPTELPPGTLAPPEPNGAVPGTIVAPKKTVLSYAWTAASLASAGAGAYHGYKRNQSIGWAVVWALCGGLFPIIVPAIALAQGFGTRKVGR